MMEFINLLLVLLVLLNCPRSEAQVPAVSCSNNVTAILEAASYARRLVNSSKWGVVSTTAFNFNNLPFGNVLSYSDGSTGTPYFYLTTLDNSTANYSMVNQGSSLTIGQFALGTCGVLDPQEPPCGKVTLLGKLKPIKPNSYEQGFARKVLFSSHPRFNLLRGFGNFDFYKLDISDIYVINGFGCPKYPSVAQYFNAKL